MRVITNHDFPPIPDRRFDWSATGDGYEPGDAIGRGPTELAAIEDLAYQLAMQDTPMTIAQVKALCGFLNITYPPRSTS